MTWLDALTEKSLARELPTRAEALSVLHSGEDELMDVVAAAFKVRLRYFGRRVKLNYLVNIKSGLCPEDCFYCSQRRGSAADVLKYTWLKPEEILKTSEAGVKAGAKRVCLVASGRGPNDADITRVSATIAHFKAEHPDVEVCACLGLLTDGQAERLRDGSRRITKITEVIGTEGDVVITQDLLTYEVQGEDEQGRLSGKHSGTGIVRPARWERARYYNLERELADALDKVNQ